MSTTDPGFWQGIIEVASGRGQLRLILQPLIAMIVGIRVGITDAKLHRDPFIERLALSDRKSRRTLAKQAARSVLLPFCLAVVFDGILQYLMLGYVRPMAALIMGVLLIWIPFALARSITNRIWRLRHPPQPQVRAT
jgi:hypothetical protein